VAYRSMMLRGYDTRVTGWKPNGTKCANLRIKRWNCCDIKHPYSNIAVYRFDAPTKPTRRPPWAQPSEEFAFFCFPCPEGFSVTCNGEINIIACLGRKTVSGSSYPFMSNRCACLCQIKFFSSHTCITVICNDQWLENMIYCTNCTINSTAM